MTAQAPLLWFLGLRPEDRRLVQEAAGDGYECRVLAGADALTFALERGDDPLLLWLGSGMWRTLRARLPHTAEILQLIPTVLVLEENAERALLEQALDGHFQQLIRFPLDRQQVFDALSRAREVRNMYQDMERMAREIMMERELLERKSEVCAFLFQSMAGLDSAAHARDLIARCRRAMGEALSVETVHALWWGKGERTYCLLDAPEGTAEAEAWQGLLLERAAADGPAHAPMSLHCGDGKRLPRPEHTLLLPLEIRGRRCGLLALDMDRAPRLGRDLSQALDAVRRHLALVLWERSQDGEFFAALPSDSASSDASQERRLSV
ncbi:MAG: hypothetical protein J1E80_03460 [Desulfovibrionaceae bacterium]|nr:hypothetical protein [Desulfovibrionaceae bacterium]